MLLTHRSSHLVPTSEMLSCLCGLFENQVKQHPNSIAIEGMGQQWIYEILNNRSNQLAHHLVDQGVTSDTLVGLCIERSFNLIVSILAILKAGAAYVPLDPSYPAERLTYILQQM